MAPTLDIVTYFPDRPSLSAISAATEQVFTRGERAEVPLYLAKLTVPSEVFGALHRDVALDAPSVTILRSCLMRPEQLDWIAAITERLADLNRAAS